VEQGELGDHQRQEEKKSKEKAGEELKQVQQFCVESVPQTIIQESTTLIFCLDRLVLSSV